MQQQQFKKERYKKEVFELLPSSISSIQVQKKNTFRYSIFIEDQFLIGVSDSTLVHFSLSKGATLSPSMFNEILEREDKWAIREYMLRLLGRRDHARNELRDKAQRKDYPLNCIEEVLDELAEKKYIDNLGFAKKFVRDKFEFNKWGINKIKSELFSKGIPEKEISIALKEISSNDRINAIKQLILKNKRKFEREADLQKRKKKIFTFLLRKGYQPSEILPQVNLIK
ncbi:MAG: regulatory protein RecX [Balneolaceae bacterium]